MGELHAGSARIFLQDDIDTIKLSREADVTYPSYSTTDPMKGTELYEYCIKRKLIDNSYQGDMNGCSKKTILACFSEKKKMSVTIFTCWVQ